MTAASGKADSGAALLRECLNSLGHEAGCTAEYDPVQPCNCGYGHLTKRITAHLATAAANGPGEESGARFISIRVDDSTHTRTADEWLALARADLKAQSTPQPGMVTVPMEPTIDMEIAGTEIAMVEKPQIDDGGYVRRIYTAMLDAALRSGGMEEITGDTHEC